MVGPSPPLKFNLVSVPGWFQDAESKDHEEDLVAAARTKVKLFHTSSGYKHQDATAYDTSFFFIDKVVGNLLPQKA